MELRCAAPETPHNDTIRAVAFSPCGVWMATGGDDKTVKLWECASWGCKWTLCAPIPDEQPRCVIIVGGR